MLKRLTLLDATAWSSFFSIVADRVGLFDLLLGFGLHHLAQPKAQPIQHRGHGTGRGHLLRALALRSQRLPGRRGRPPRGGYARAKRRGLLRMRIGELPQRFGHLRLPRFPAFAATASRWRTKTHAPGASRSEAKRYGLAPPPQDGFRHQGIAVTIFQCHLGLKSSSCGAGHWGCREA